MNDTFVIEALEVGFEMEIANPIVARKKELWVELGDGKKAVIRAFKLNNRKVYK